MSRTHHIVDGTHITHVVSEQGAHLLLPPMSCCMQRRPPVYVTAVHIHPTLQQHPEHGQEERRKERGRWTGEGLVQHQNNVDNLLSLVDWCSLQDFNVAFGRGDMESGRLGVWVRCESAPSCQHCHGVLQHDPLLLLSGLVHVYSCTHVNKQNKQTLDSLKTVQRKSMCHFKLQRTMQAGDRTKYPVLYPFIFYLLSEIAVAWWTFTLYILDSDNDISVDPQYIAVKVTEHLVHSDSVLISLPISVFSEWPLIKTGQKRQGLGLYIYENS